jgi:hypothetical protein
MIEESQIQRELLGRSRVKGVVAGHQSSTRPKMWSTEMIRTVSIVAASLFAASPAFTTSDQAAGQPEEALVTLERKLHGKWKGDPCAGDWTFAPDSTYEVQHYSPGNNELSGTWRVRWDALPPTLVLTCKTSDAPDRIKVGENTEVKLIQLDDNALIYQYPGGRTYRFTRPKK